MKTSDVLETAAWAQRHFGSLVSGGSIRKRDLVREEKRGNLECVGMVEICDGDGAIIPGKGMRFGFRLTNLGWKTITPERDTIEAIRIDGEGSRLLREPDAPIISDDTKSNHSGDQRCET